MTLSTLIIRIGLAGLALLFLIGFWKYKQKVSTYSQSNRSSENTNQPIFWEGHQNWLMAFFQYFCGIWFLFSGFVKAVDPLGTSYKLVDYFNEFKLAFEGTWFSFLAPMFPWMAENFSVQVSVITIVFEIVLGAMLILGARPKFTSWAFFLLMLFFTFLTGFTYLTGYVPGGANFFEFSEWGAYNKNNMRVTDCGCFGDFIKLEPKTSFIKDVFLMIPAFFFIWKHREMTQLFTPRIRDFLTGLVFGISLIYCLSNYVWDIPSVDFRPFYEGRNIAVQKELEADALADAPVTYILENKASKEQVRLSMDEYLKRYKEFPKDSWSTDTEAGEPSVPQTKISDFALMDPKTGYEVTEEILTNEGYSLMMVCYMLKGEPIKKQRILKDTLFTVDTVLVFEDGKEEMQIVKSVKEVNDREEEYYETLYEEEYMDKFKSQIVPLAESAKKQGITFYGAIGKADLKALEQFKRDSGLDVALYTADDILLKTIVRSNPGIVLWKDGQIVKKWHINKLPNFDEIKENYLK